MTDLQEKLSGIFMMSWRGRIHWTNMTGYQETLTDPSFCGQIVVMTYPLIGNYGGLEDMESDKPCAFSICSP